MKPPLRADWDKIFDSLVTAIKNLMIEQGVNQERLSRLSGVKKLVLNEFLEGHGDILLGDLVDIFFVLNRRIRLELQRDKET